jgi:hypothetical protein
MQQTFSGQSTKTVHVLTVSHSYVRSLLSRSPRSLFAVCARLAAVDKLVTLACIVDYVSAYLSVVQRTTPPSDPSAHQPQRFALADNALVQPCSVDSVTLVEHGIWEGRRFLLQTYLECKPPQGNLSYRRGTGRLQ